ncbi:uncharacterized protein LOC144691180 [Cetorhinus maximus]
MRIVIAAAPIAPQDSIEKLNAHLNMILSVNVVKTTRTMRNGAIHTTAPFVWEPVEMISKKFKAVPQQRDRSVSVNQECIVNLRVSTSAITVFLTRSAAWEKN